MTSRPENLGVTNGQLMPCPETPNCVCSQGPSEDSEHFITPMSYTVSPALLQEKILDVISDTARVRIVTASDDYIHLEATTALMRFVDDFELYIDKNEKLLHFRSASRIGHSDFGANRKRVETFKSMLSARLENL